MAEQPGAFQPSAVERALSQAEKEKIKLRMVEDLKGGWIERAQALADEHQISPEDFFLAVEKALVFQIVQTDLAYLDDMFEQLGVDRKEKFIQSPEVQQAAKEGILFGLGKAKAEAVVQIIRDCKVPEAVLQAEDLKIPARNGALLMLQRGSLLGMKKLAKAFNLPADLFTSDEAKNIARARVAQLREKNLEEAALALEKEFGLT